MIKDNDDILRLIWSRGEHSCNAVRGGRCANIKVMHAGEPEEATGNFYGAEIEIDGIIVKGDVVFGRNAADALSRYAVLHVVEDAHSPSLIGFGGERIPQLALHIPEHVARSVESLREGSANAECALWLCDADTHLRTSVIDSLMLERLRNKSGEVKEVFNDCEDDWNQTAYVMLFRAMGADKNQDTFIRLARKATFTMAMRERSSLPVVEALLLGTSGLMEECYYDDYINLLRQHFTYLQNKYLIEPMRPLEWTSRGYPASKPILAIAKLASLLCSGKFSFDAVLKCHTPADVHRLFEAEASEYWVEHYVPDRKSHPAAKRIGNSKAESLAINMIVPVMFAYGSYMEKEKLKEDALELLTKIKPEKNRIIDRWSGVGTPLTSAYDTQALLELSKRYCAHRRCTECKIGRRIIKKAERALAYTIK